MNKLQKNEDEDEWDDPELWKQMDEVVKIHKEKKNSKTTEQGDDMTVDDTDQEHPAEVITKLLFKNHTVIYNLSLLFINHIYPILLSIDKHMINMMHIMILVCDI